MSIPNSPISFHVDAVNTNMLPDSIVTKSRKRKPTFSMNDPNNVELARLATQAAKKKAKLSKNNSSEKKLLTQKNRVQKTVNHLLKMRSKSSHHAGRASHGTPRTLLSQAMMMTSLRHLKQKKGYTLSQNKKTNWKINKKMVPKLEQNRQPSAEDVDNESESGDDDDIEDSEMVDVFEKPAESAEAELSQ